MLNGNDGKETFIASCPIGTTGDNKILELLLVSVDFDY